MRAGEIAEELDCSHQLIGRRGKHLEERKLVVRDVDEDGRRTYELTSFAKDSYFDTRFAADLRILPEAEDKDKKT
jgi:DNA-binding HxlR family transcriptional regulator